MKNLCRDMNLSEFRISDTIIDVCSEIKDKFKGEDFAIICKITFEDNKLKILPDYQIPRQTIKGSYIYFDSEHIEELKTKGYTFVIRICSNKHNVKVIKNLDQSKVIPLFKIFNEMGRCLKVCSFQITKNDLDSAAVSNGIKNYYVRYVKSGRKVELSKLPLTQDVRITSAECHG